MKGITTIASLPGSGAGSASALPAEKHLRPKEKAPDPLDAWFQPIPRASETVTVNVITGATTTPADARRIAEQVMHARNREARPKSYIEGGFVLGAPIPARRVMLRGGSPRHTWNDGRGLRDVYVDGVKIKNCMEADTAEGWVRIHRDARPGEFSPGGVDEVIHGKVEVFSAGTIRPADLLDVSGGGE